MLRAQNIGIFNREAQCAGNRKIPIEHFYPEVT